MTTMQLLHLEDTDAQATSLQDAVADWNGNNQDRQFALVRARNVEEAEDLMAVRNFDAAILDLKVPAKADGGKGSIESGNSLAKITLSRIGIPIAIVSGFPADLDAGLAEAHVEVFDKTKVDAFEKVVAWVATQWDLMLALRQTRRRIQEMGADVFVKRIWQRWTSYSSLAGATKTEIVDIITRQYGTHIAELLGLAGEGSAKWHPSECYIQPPLPSKRVQTGDLLQLEDGLWIVVSPACDLANEKIVDVLLVRANDSAEEDWTKFVASLTEHEVSPKEQRGREKYFNRLVRQNLGPSEHFLPPLKPGSPPIMVSFPTIRTRPLASINANLETVRIASIAPSFLPNLVQRFGAYISRTGQPDIDFNHFA